MDSSRSTRGNRTLIWVGGACLAVLLCGLAIFLLGFGGFYWLGTQLAEEVDVNWDLPSVLAAGETFKIDLAIVNITTTAVELANIDISTDYLQGILIETTSPLYIDSFEYAAWGGGEVFQSYSFKQTIPPGETLVVAFNGKALMRGDYTGTIAICINSTINCKTNVMRTIVE